MRLKAFPDTFPLAALPDILYIMHSTAAKGCIFKPNTRQRDLPSTRKYSGNDFASIATNRVTMNTSPEGIGSRYFGMRTQSGVVCA